jgi:hypothetical protein
LNSSNGPTLAMSNTRGNNGRQHSIYSQSPIEVIDLTDSPPHPHPLPAPRHQTNFSTSSRDIIDLDSLPDPPPPPRQPSYSLPLPHLRQHPVFLPGEDITRNFNDIITLGDFNDETSPPPPPPPPPLPQQPRSNTDYGLLSLLRNQFLGSTASTSRPQEVTHYHYHIHHQPRLPPVRPVQTHFVPPGRLNYTLNAQHIYDDDTPLRDHPGFKDEAYRALPPPRDGFTRSPKENMALICPSCGDELGKNPDDLVKKEVWVAKCGHTYCGGCAATQRQNKARGVKVGRCIVDGCTRIISGEKGMMEVFL